MVVRGRTTPPVPAAGVGVPLLLMPPPPPAPSVDVPAELLPPFCPLLNPDNAAAAAPLPPIVAVCDVDADRATEDGPPLPLPL